jgi:hypothetical protein
MSAGGPSLMPTTWRCTPNHRAVPASLLDRANRPMRLIAQCTVVLLALASCASPYAQPNPVPTASPPPSATPATPPVAPATATPRATLSPPASATNAAPSLPSEFPPGEYLVYIQGAGRSTLHMLRLDTEEDAKIADDVGLDAAIHFPSWSLATTLFEFAGGSYPDGLFRVTDLISGAVLTTSSDGISSPSWSPDGANLAAAFKRDLAIIPLDGGTPSIIARCSDRPPEGEWVCGAASWAPDGRRIAYVQSVSGAGDPDPDAGVYILQIELASGGQWQSRREHGPLAGVIYSGPRWSPDSTCIAFPTRKGIEIFDVERGSTVRELYLDFIPDSLVWSPDGQRLAVTSNGYLSIVDAQSGLAQSQRRDLAMEAVVAWISLPLTLY